MKSCVPFVCDRACDDAFFSSRDVVMMITFFVVVVVVVVICRREIRRQRRKDGGVALSLFPGAGANATRFDVEEPNERGFATSASLPSGWMRE
jgi:hypothetical protein